MSIPSAVKSTPIRDRQQLTDYLAAGEKPREAWLIGTEHITTASLFQTPQQGRHLAALSFLRTCQATMLRL